MLVTITCSGAVHALSDTTLCDKFLFKFFEKTHHHFVNHVAKCECIVAHLLVSPLLEEIFVVAKFVVVSTIVEHLFKALFALYIKV